MLFNKSFYLDKGRRTGQKNGTILAKEGQLVNKTTSIGGKQVFPALL